MKNKEVELKVLISYQNLRMLLNKDFMKAAVVKDSKQKRKLISSYYDTEDLAFKKNGIAYRVRDKGDGTFEATVKTGKKNQGGITERVEVNIPLEKDEAVLEGFGALGLGFELTELAPDGVKRLFTVDVDRTTYDLEFEGSTFELAVDKGKITSGLNKNKEKIDEMEIELKEGSVKTLLKLAALIAKAVPIFVEPRSKFARGLTLIGIDSTYPIAKRKIGSGPVFDEILEAFTQKGNLAMTFAEAIMGEDYPNEILKLFAKQLEYMLSYVLFAEELDGNGVFTEYIDTLKDILSKIHRTLDLCKMHDLWCTIDLDRKAFSKTFMRREIEKNIVMAEMMLVDSIFLGQLTAVFYGVQSALTSIECETEECQDGTAAARAVLEKWMKNVSVLKSVNENLNISDNMMYLARSVDSKFAAKLASTLKKKRTLILKQALDERMEEELVSMLKNSGSKYLSRDIGVLLGMLITKEYK